LRLLGNAMTFRIDPQRTTLGFSVKHMMIATVRGTFPEYDAELEVDPHDLEKSRVSAKVATHQVQTGDRLRDEYLVGAHFFNPARYPHILFKSERVRVSGSKLSISGPMTIRERTLPLTLEGKYRHTSHGTPAERLVFELSAELDREAYDLVFNGAVETVSIVVGKKVKLDLNIELVHA
jgi:polyisoprenoid-binding protein YceI